MPANNRGSRKLEKKKRLKKKGAKEKAPPSAKFPLLCVANLFSRKERLMAQHLYSNGKN